MISFVVEGDPKGKGRPRFTYKGHAFTPKNTAMYENYVRLKASEALPEGFKPYTKPLEVVIVCNYKIPKSFTKKKRELAINGYIYPTVKPDVDNIVKAILDSMNGIVYEDDKQVIHCDVYKFYDDNPRTIVTVGEVEGKI